MIDWKKFSRPIVALAPMADLADLPFCLICKEHGASLMFREMVSSEAVVRKNPKTLEMARIDERERPLVQQLFGSDPATMAEAARIIEETFHPDGFDINMGCPVYNIVSNFNGAFLIKEPMRASAIIKAVKDAVKAPVSVKTRLGWDDDREILEFVKVIEDAGTDLVSIHGRTKAQGYSGKANWERIGEARKNTSLPLLVNGDIVSPETAKQAIEQSGADGILIGRGALGNPWIFRRIETYLANGTLLPESTIEERFETMIAHAENHAARYNGSLVKLRKHLPWYIKGFPNLRDLKSKLVRVSTVEDLKNILSL
jgi:tRNA-dihydrouridine synthase B